MLVCPTLNCAGTPTSGSGPERVKYVPNSCLSFRFLFFVVVAHVAQTAQRLCGATCSTYSGHRRIWLREDGCPRCVLSVLLLCSSMMWRVGDCDRTVIGMMVSSRTEKMTILLVLPSMPQPRSVPRHCQRSVYPPTQSPSSDMKP